MCYQSERTVKAVDGEAVSFFVYKIIKDYVYREMIKEK